jgi:hypothetical protein
MDNDLNRTDSIIKEHIPKIQQLTNKLLSDYTQSIIDPVNLDEIRKILKVDYFNKVRNKKKQDNSTREYIFFRESYLL